MTTEAAINQTFANESILDDLESRVVNLADSSKKGYKKAIVSLKNFIISRTPPFPMGSARFLESWIVYMFYSGLSAKTALLYFNIFAALYNALVEEKSLPDQSAEISRIKAKFIKLQPHIWRRGLEREDYNHFLERVRHGLNSGGKTNIANSMIRMAMMNPEMTLADVAALKSHDIPKLNPESQEIARRCLSPRHKFVFALDQSRLTPRQLAEKAERVVNEYFLDNFIRKFDKVDETIRAYWAYGALDEGMSTQYVVAMAGYMPQAFPILAICAGMEPPEKDIKIYRAFLAERLFNNPQKWFAIRLRSGYKFERLLKDTEEISKSLGEIEFFYPTEEIARKIKKKIIFRTRPIIRNIVFVKCTLPSLRLLLKNLGAYVWCYKTFYSKRQASYNYAEIPSGSIDNFRKAIGMLTPAHDLGPVGSHRLEAGDRVVVLSGIFCGMEGEIMQHNFSEKGVVYRVRLFGDMNDIEWKISDPDLLAQNKKLKNA